MMDFLQQIYDWLFPWKPNYQRQLADKVGSYYVALRPFDLYDKYAGKWRLYAPFTVFVITTHEPLGWGDYHYDIMLAFPKTRGEYNAFGRVECLEREFRPLSPLEILAMQAE